MSSTLQASLKMATRCLQDSALKFCKTPENHFQKMPEYSFLYSFFDRPDVLALMLAQLVARESYTVVLGIRCTPKFSTAYYKRSFSGSYVNVG